MEWKSRRRELPEWLEPSLSDAASAEEEGLDHLIFIEIVKNFGYSGPNFALYIWRQENDTAGV